MGPARAFRRGPRGQRDGMSVEGGRRKSCSGTPVQGKQSNDP